MSRWFYGAWAVAVVLVLVLPVAIPFWVWPSPETGPGTWSGPAGEEMFGRWARTQVEFANLVPTSVEVGPEFRSPVPCDGPTAMHELPRLYTAKVTLRGAYGLPLDSYEVTCSGSSRVGGGEISGLELGGGLELHLLALLGGVVVVSIPFFPFWLRQRLRATRESVPQFSR